MTADGTIPENAAADPRRPRWLLYAILGATGLLYAYAIWNAVAYMVPLVGLALGATTWVALILSLVLPVVVYAIAIALTRRRRPRHRRARAGRRPRAGGGVLARRRGLHAERRTLTSYAVTRPGLPGPLG